MEFYILSTPKSWIKKFFEDGTWSKEKMTSCIVERDNGKIIQIFGSCGSYGEIGERVSLISDQSGRHLGYGTIVGHNKNVFKNVSTYVFK